MFKVKHVPTGIVRTVYGVSKLSRTDSTSTILFLMYQKAIKQWAWIEAKNFEPLVGDE